MKNRLTYLLALLTFSPLLAHGFGFGEVELKPGYSITALPSIGAFKVGSSDLVSGSGIVTDLYYGGKLRFGMRNAKMQSQYLEISYFGSNFVAPADAALYPSKLSNLGFIYESWSDSRERFKWGYSFGAIQEDFVSSVARRAVYMETAWIFRARLHLSLAVYSPSFGPRAQYDNNVSAKDSPKVRLEIFGGALTPHRSKFLSKNWGYEMAGKITYGNSVSWVGLSYDRQEQNSGNQNQRRTSVIFEWAIGLDIPVEVRQRGAAWRQ